MGSEGGIEGILAKAESDEYRRVVSARVPLIKQAVLDEREDLLERIGERFADDTLDGDELTERVAEIDEEIVDSEVVFRFASIGYTAWQKVLGQHPPTRDQRLETPGLDHNPESFPFAVMAASCIDPVMDYEQVKRLCASDAVNVRGYEAMWSACLAANVHGATPKVGPGLTRRPRGRSGS